MILAVLEDVAAISAADNTLGARWYMTHIVAFMFLYIFLGHFLGHTLIHTATFRTFLVELFSLHFLKTPFLMMYKLV